MRIRSGHRFVSRAAVVATVLITWPSSGQGQASTIGQSAPINEYNAIHHPVVGRHGMVATQNAEATRVGVEVLERGGDAIDAAAAVGPALAVTLPRADNLGGGGFMLVHLADEGRTVVEGMETHNGLITKEDLAHYRVVEREPVRGTYRGVDIAAMSAPPSGGMHIVQMLNILESFPIRELGYGSADAMHIMAESMKLAYADRSKYLGDPDHLDLPVAALTSKAYAKSLTHSGSWAAPTIKSCLVGARSAR